MKPSIITAFLLGAFLCYLGMITFDKKEIKQKTEYIKGKPITEYAKGKEDIKTEKKKFNAHAMLTPKGNEKGETPSFSDYERTFTNGESSVKIYAETYPKTDSLKITIDWDIVEKSFYRVDTVTIKQVDTVKVYSTQVEKRYTEGIIIGASAVLIITELIKLIRG
jgi:hypothetical protein